MTEEQINNFSIIEQAQEWCEGKQWWWRSFDHLIAGFVWLLAVLSMLICFLTGGWLL